MPLDAPVDPLQDRAVPAKGLTMRRPQSGAQGHTRQYTDQYTACMASDRMLRVSGTTHAGFREEARRRGVTIDAVATAALRALRQKEMGEQLADDLTDEETQWLDAPLG